jgi:hypothetical protein
MRLLGHIHALDTFVFSGPMLCDALCEFTPSTLDLFPRRFLESVKRLNIQNSSHSLDRLMTSLLPANSRFESLIELVMELPTPLWTDVQRHRGEERVKVWPSSVDYFASMPLLETMVFKERSYRGLDFVLYLEGLRKRRCFCLEG